MIKMFSCCLMLSAVLLVVPAAAENIGSVKVRDNLFMLVAEGGNIGVLTGDDGTLMIDDKFAPLTDAILAKVSELGGTTPRFVINTHYHADHTGGNENLGKAGSVIVSHANVRRQLSVETVIEAFNRVMPPQPPEGLPILTFTRDITFHVNGETIDVVHVPTAHTDGDSIVHFRNANAIHAGDIVFNGFYPFIDVARGGTLKGMIAAVDTILERSNAATRIIPGHGLLASRQDLEGYRDMLATALARLGELKAEGKTAAEAAAAQPLADLEARWGNAMFTGARWIEVIYDGI